MRFARMTLFMALLWSGAGFAASDESARIDGVAQFLIDRANDNYLYIFEKKIRDNESLKCYFPNTRANLDVGGLKQLLYSHGLWADSIGKDLKILAARSWAAGMENKLALSQRAVDLSDSVITALQGLTIEYKGQRYPLNAMPVTNDPQLRALINGFYTPFTDLSDALEVFKQYKGIDICNMPAQDPDKLKQDLAALIHLSDTLQRFTAHVRQHAGELAIIDGSKPLVCRALAMEEGCSPPADFGQRLADTVTMNVTNVIGEQAASMIIEGTEALQTYQDPSSTTTTKVVAALRLINRTGSLSEGEFENLSRYIMFFAQISDSDSADKVDKLLVAYTLPAVSFFTKREYGVHWMITSYLGISGGKTRPDLPAGGKKNNDGIFAPIGLELTYGTKECGSISLMLSPFDFGYPVSLKLNGVQQDAKLNDIIAPTISMAYGLREYPIVWGLAYQRGRVIQSTGQQETRTMLFVAFDLPLFGLN